MSERPGVWRRAAEEETGVMIEKWYRDLCAGRERRAALSGLKQAVREEKNRQELMSVTGGNLDEIMKCLADPDAKVRKNAAALLGELRAQDALDVLMDAYEAEEQLFVRADYVKAMAALDCGEYLSAFHARLGELDVYAAPDNEKKHIQAEKKELRELILKQEGLKKHTFCGYHRANEVIFVTAPAFRDVLAAQIGGRKKLLRGGVRTVVTDMEEALKIRVFDEMLFVLHIEKELSDSPQETARALPDRPQEIARALADSDLMEILRENHREEPPFYFRVGVAGTMPAEERSRIAKRTAEAVEEQFKGALFNSSSHYEAELRLMPDRAGGFTPFLKLYTLPDHRFDYRRQHVAASMRPALAAGLLALAKPWLREHAQVLDPFCGVGTLLIERRFLMSVRSAYGLDIFGEAIEKARANSRVAGMPVNYINRDFFDFTHAYLFDEIITDMPAEKDRERTDALYGRFFAKSAEVLSEKGRIVCFSREMGLVKKHLRLQGGFRLLQEFCIQEKSGAYLFVLEKR